MCGCFRPWLCSSPLIWWFVGGRACSVKVVTRAVSCSAQNGWGRGRTFRKDIMMRKIGQSVTGQPMVMSGRRVAPRRVLFRAKPPTATRPSLTQRRQHRAVPSQPLRQRLGEQARQVLQPQVLGSRQQCVRGVAPSAHSTAAPDDTCPTDVVQERVRQEAQDRGACDEGELLPRRCQTQKSAARRVTCQQRLWSSPR